MRCDHLLTVRLSLWIQGIKSFYPSPQLAHHLGNDKPSTLQQVEDAILQMILNVADGSTAQDEVQKFLQDFNNMTSIWEQEDRSPDEYCFFASRECIPYEIECNHLMRFDSSD